jgi:hypothetical protein
MERHARQLKFDEAEYYDLAGQLIHGQHEFGPRRVIGHPAALALMRLGLGDQIFRVQLCVSLIFSLTAPLTDTDFSRSGAVLTGRAVQLLMLSDQKRDARSRVLSDPRARMPWPIAPTDEFMSV